MDNILNGQKAVSKNKLKVMNCSICTKTFQTTGNLKKHIHTIHEGHKENKCEYCSKSFSEAGSLKKHILTKYE